MNSSDMHYMYSIEYRYPDNESDSSWRVGIPDEYLDFESAKAGLAKRRMKNKELVEQGYARVEYRLMRRGYTDWEDITADTIAS